MPRQERRNGGGKARLTVEERKERSRCLEREIDGQKERQQEEAVWEKRETVKERKIGLLCCFCCFVNFRMKCSVAAVPRECEVTEELCLYVEAVECCLKWDSVCVSLCRGRGEGGV